MIDLSGGVGSAIWNAAEVAVVVSSVQGVLYATPAFCRFIGVPIEQLAGSALASFATVEGQRGLASALADVLEGADVCRHEVQLQSTDGREVETEHTCRAIEAGGGRVAVSTFVPIRDSNRLADALAASEQRYRDLFEEDTDGRFVSTPDWHLIDCNGVLARDLGYADSASLIGRSLLDFTPDGPILQKLLAVARVEGRAGPVELQMERQDGTLSDVSCLIAGSPGESGAFVSLRGQIAEITERKRLETRLHGAERMEVIGRLAGGLAHDFNNLLTVISGNVERLLGAMTDHDPLKVAVSAIDQAAARAASMTRQLLAYGRRQIFELRPLSLQALIADARPLLSEILGDHIVVHVALSSDLPQISADPRQIEHVLANLALNAREAMPSGGTLTITVDGMEVGDNAPRKRVWLRPGRYVRLIVSDTGHGMDPVTRGYAFQPFFTTKRMGNGRGLGLATVYGIVKQSHGFVWVESEVGQGATFTLLFPALKSERADSAVAARADVGETILVVEADAAVRTFVGEALRRRGYQVLDATSGAAAVEIFASHPSRIHLVVSDSRAVTSQGAPLVPRLQAIDPIVQSLVMLEPPGANANSPRVLPTTPSIQKPFTLQALADKIREVLESGEGRG
jgi:PAS domain S-box-containing protein